MEIYTKGFSQLDDLQKLEPSTPTLEERSSIWSILLAYLQNEQNALGHYGLRQDDMVSELWQIIDENADLDHKGAYAFSSVLGEIASAATKVWSESLNQMAPSDWTRDNSLWNDSIEWMIRYLYQYINPIGTASYENSGYLIENDDGTINTRYLKGSIPVTYTKEKYYLFPDFTGDGAIRIVYNTEEEITEDLFTLDDRMGGMWYSLYNLHKDVMKQAMCNSTTIEQAYSQLFPFFEEGYSYSYFYNAVMNTDLDNEAEMLKAFYYFVTIFIESIFELELVYERIELFVVWCDDNRISLQNTYGVKINIEKTPLIWTLTTDTAVLGLIYKQFCEDNYIEAPYIEIGDDFAFRVKDIKKADAGNAFVPESKMYELLGQTLTEVVNPWVVPWYNINAHTYKYVRGEDRINSVLASDDHLQFTVEQDKKADKYIRLIMPEYKRRVEVEDLNRDFWVIAQVISAISAYLFEQGLATMFKELLNEIMQLWENVMYLWVAQSTLNTTLVYPDTHIEFVYVPNCTEQPFLKYDGFDEVTSSDVLQERLRYLIRTYTENNVCVIPIVRQNNYAKEYYSCERYPGAMFYDRAADTTEWWSFAGNDKWRDSAGIKIDATALRSDIWGAMEQNRYYYYCKPLDDISLYQIEGKVDFFYGGIRVIPEATYDNRKLQITFNLEDAARSLLEGEYSLGKLVLQLDNGEVTSFTDSYTGTAITEHTYQNGDLIDDAYRVEVQRGWYLGEFPSCRTLCDQMSFDIITRQIIGKPIDLDFTASSLSDTDTRKDYTGATFLNGRGGSQVFDTLEQIIDFTEKNDQIMLEYILQNSPSIIENTGRVYFYTIQHYTSLWSGGDNDLLSSNINCTVMPHTDLLIGNGVEPSIHDYDWLPTDQTITDYEKNIANHFAQRSAFAAVIYGPKGFIPNNFQSYSSYFYTSKIPSSATYGNEPLLYSYVENYVHYTSGGSNTSCFTYIKKGEKVSSNNWIIMLVQSDGGSPICNAAVDAGYGYELTTPVDFTNYTDSPETPRDRYNGNYGIMTHTLTSLFLPGQINYYQNASRVCWGDTSYDWTYSYDDKDAFEAVIADINENYTLYAGANLKNFFLFPENGVDK